MAQTDEEKYEEALNALLKKYEYLFKDRDFYISDHVDEDVDKAIEIGDGKYICFMKRSISDTIEQKLKAYIEEQNEKIKKGEKPFMDIE